MGFNSAFKGLNVDQLNLDQYTFMKMSVSVLLRMRNVGDKICRENKNTYFVLDFFFSKIVPFMR